MKVKTKTNYFYEITSTGLVKRAFDKTYVVESDWRRVLKVLKNKPFTILYLIFCIILPFITETSPHGNLIRGTILGIFIYSLIGDLYKEFEK